MRYTFQKHSKLTTKEAFTHVFNKGKRISFGDITFVYCQNNLAFPRLGIIISRYAKTNAVIRNRLKRVIRESFRLKIPLIANVDVIILVRKVPNEINLRLVLEREWQALAKKQ